MKTNFQMVREFHKAFGVIDLEKPGFPDIRVRELRVELIEEELDELYDAEDEDNLVAVADALTDIAYVVYGMAAQYGIDLDACFREVHASNMSKLDEDGKPIYRADGKVLKGKNFRKPNLEQFIK